MTDYKKVNDYILKATDKLAEGDSPEDWGHARLSRIFNFKSQQVTTLYERGGAKRFTMPRGDYSGEAGYTTAVTSAMDIKNFSDIESDDEIAKMYGKLVSLGGKPPALEEILPRLGKKRASLG